MKKIILIIFLLIIPINIKAIETKAESAILMDIDSNRILYSKNIHNVRSVASISKIMTSLVAIENSDINKRVTIGDEINKAYGSGIYIQKGEILTIKDLLYGLMLRSGNDAALAISYHVSGSTNKFVELMNKTSQKIGMTESTFNNPSGLDEDDDGNLSSAYDMSLLMSYAYKKNIFKQITGTKKYKLKTNKNIYIWNNKNKLLNTYKYSTGGKTGFTKRAKRTLVTTAEKNNLRLVAVTLNDGNDWKDHKDLFEYGFENYKNYQILKKGNIEVYDDKYYNDYNFYIKNNYTYPLSDNEKDTIMLKINLTKSRTLKNNEKVGVINIYIGDNEIHKENIYIKERKVKNNLFDKIKNWFNNV